MPWKACAVALPAGPLESLSQERGYSEQPRLQAERCCLLKLQRDFRHWIPTKAAAGYALGHPLGSAAWSNSTQAPASPGSKAGQAPKGSVTSSREHKKPPSQN